MQPHRQPGDKAAKGFYTPRSLFIISPYFMSDAKKGGLVFALVAILITFGIIGMAGGEEVKPEQAAVGCARAQVFSSIGKQKVFGQPSVTRNSVKSYTVDLMAGGRSHTCEVIVEDARTSNCVTTCK